MQNRLFRTLSLEASLFPEQVLVRWFRWSCHWLPESPKGGEGTEDDKRGRSSREERKLGVHAHDTYGQAQLDWIIVESNQIFGIRILNLEIKPVECFGGWWWFGLAAHAASHIRLPRGYFVAIEDSRANQDLAVVWGSHGPGQGSFHWHWCFVIDIELGSACKSGGMIWGNPKAGVWGCWFWFKCNINI